MRISTSQFQNQSLNGVLEQQSKLAKLQQQMGTGRRILTPADDPVGASRALEISTTLQDMERIKSNADLAESKLNREESALEQAGSVLQRIRELTLQGNNASQDAANRRAIAVEIRARLDELIGIANAQDGDGEYLFAGMDSLARPFTRTAAGVAYGGDQVERLVQVGPERQLPVNHTGFAVFMKIPNGNGDFIAAPTGGNNGTGIISPGELSDPDATRTYPYQISFALNPVSDEMEYTVTDGNGATVVAATPYVEEQAITFDGVTVSIKGEPADGDGFDVTPSGNQSVFTTIENVISALETGRNLPEDRALAANRINRSLTELDGAMENILKVRADVGSRMNAIDTELDGLEDATLDLETSLANIEDLDYASAISEFKLQLVGLEAAQQSFVQIQGLSLFNYLR